MKPIVNELNGAKEQLKDNQYVVENLSGTLWMNEKKEQATVHYITRRFSDRVWVAMCPKYEITEKTPEEMITALKKLGWTFKGWD